MKLIKIFCKLGLHNYKCGSEYYPSIHARVVEKWVFTKVCLTCQKKVSLVWNWNHGESFYKVRIWTPVRYG